MAKEHDEKNQPMVMDDDIKLIIRPDNTDSSGDEENEDIEDANPLAQTSDGKNNKLQFKATNVVAAIPRNQQDTQYEDEKVIEARNSTNFRKKLNNSFSNEDLEIRIDSIAPLRREGTISITNNRHKFAKLNSSSEHYDECRSMRNIIREDLNLVAPIHSSALKQSNSNANL